MFCLSQVRIRSADPRDEEDNDGTDHVDGGGDDVRVDLFDEQNLNGSDDDDDVDDGDDDDDDGKDGNFHLPTDLFLYEMRIFDDDEFDSVTCWVTVTRLADEELLEFQRQVRQEVISDHLKV